MIHVTAHICRSHMHTCTLRVTHPFAAINTGALLSWFTVAIATSMLLMNELINYQYPDRTITTCSKHNLNIFQYEWFLSHFRPWSVSSCRFLIYRQPSWILSLSQQVLNRSSVPKPNLSGVLCPEFYIFILEQILAQHGRQWPYQIFDNWSYCFC